MHFYRTPSKIADWNGVSGLFNRNQWLSCELKRSTLAPACLPTLSTSTQHKLTLMMIFSFSWVGDGSWSALASTGFIKSWSPNTSLNTLAMCRCCSTLQCSSIDRMTGYLWRKQTNKVIPLAPTEKARKTPPYLNSQIKKIFKANKMAKGEVIHTTDTVRRHLWKPPTPNPFFRKAQFLS